jgi:hypothetical protein
MSKFVKIAPPVAGFVLLALLMICGMSYYYTSHKGTPHQLPTEPTGTPHQLPTEPTGTPHQLPTEPTGTPHQLPTEPTGIPHQSPIKPLEPLLENHVAEGSVTISGEMKVGKVLTATNNITDRDGIIVNPRLDGLTEYYNPNDPGAKDRVISREYSGKNGRILYQWLIDDADILGATGEKYELTSNDLGSVINVRAIFNDALGNPEIKISTNTKIVTGEAPIEVP